MRRSRVQISKLIITSATSKRSSRRERDDSKATIVTEDRIYLCISTFVIERLLCFWDKVRILSSYIDPWYVSVRNCEKLYNFLSGISRLQNFMIYSHIIFNHAVGPIEINASSPVFNSIYTQTVLISYLHFDMQNWSTTLSVFAYQYSDQFVIHRNAPGASST